MTSSPTPTRSHPWRTLRDEFPHIELVWSVLPSGVNGHTDGRTRIWLDQRLSQVRRRCVLTHELWHVRRGILPADEMEERICDELAARELVQLPDLITGFMWSLHTETLASHLWVDMPTLRVRLETLDPAEVAELEEALECAWWQSP